LVHGFWLHRAELVQNSLGKSNRDRSAKNRGSCNRRAKLKNVNNIVRKKLQWENYAINSKTRLTYLLRVGQPLGDMTRWLK
jgi:hypothetical protein